MASDPLIGKQLGDYKIVGLLGRGGMSRVYRGYDDNLDRYAAVKVISGDFVTTSEDEYTRRFQIEARSIARLRHPSIVGVYQFGRSHGIYYMAMVWLDGKDLRTILRDYARTGQRMPDAEVLRITRDVAGALDYAHEQGVIHRDIKPSNIMLERETGRAVLMDFGLALSVQEGTQGDTFGSAHYIAPEQAISSAKAVPQSDLYSLGIVLYEMLTGQVPFDDPSAMSVALHHLNDPPPPPRDVNPDLSPEVESVLLRVLAKDPGQRYVRGYDLVEALAAALPPQIETPQDRTASRPAGAGNDLLEMLDRPARDEEPPSFLARLSVDDPPLTQQVPPPGQNKLAEKFAQRKAVKQEEDFQQNMDPDSLQLDADALDSLLDSYADPRELGLVGPDRDSQLSRAHAPAQSDAQPRSRRSRMGRLLAVLLLVLVAGGVVYFALGIGQESGDKTADGSSAQVVGGDQTLTPDVPDDTSPEPETPSSSTPTQFPDAEAVPQSAVTSTAALSLTPTLERDAAQTATSALEALPPEDVSPAVTPSDGTSPTPGSNTAEPSATSDEITPTGDVPGTEPTQETGSLPVAALNGDGDELKLVYNADGLLLINASDRTLDVSGLVFERVRADGVKLLFEAKTWSTYTLQDTNAMLAQSCYQIIVANATQVSPSRVVCPHFLGWYRATIPRRYFWVPDPSSSGGTGESAAVFIVRNAEGTVLAECDLDGSPCTFDLQPAD